ncbi:MAG: tail fiber domain-containing protein [Bacteroidales bacterium]
MSKSILIIVSIIMVYSFNLFSQVPEAFKYQAVLRNSDGELISGQEVSLKISILNESSTGEVVYSEEHSATTSNLGMVSLSIGEGTVISGNFQSIAWGDGDKYLKIEIDESGGSSYSELGTIQLLSVPYALYANAATKLGNNLVYSTSTDTLFVVKDHEGNIVFAVYPDGAEVIANETAKGKIGGFAVSGRTSTKAEQEFLRITPDSARIYLNEDLSKGKIGGFAVSGRTATKGLVNDFLYVTGDSTRIYVNDSLSNKGKIGGFAVSGRTSTKGEISSLMSLTRNNYFIGHEAGKSNTDGLYNSFMGYKTGYSNTIGERNTFLGYFSGYTNVYGDGNIFIGDSSGYFNNNGNNNVFIGNTSGKFNNSGYRNVFLGNESGYGNINGRYNVFIGYRTGRQNTSGEQNVIIGATSGFSNTTGYRNVFVGNWCGFNNSIGYDNIFLGNRSGWNNTEGSSNIFIGSYSGHENTLGVDNIFIGTDSGNKNTTSSNNIFLGKLSGYSNETGSENIFIGKESGYSNLEGDLNVCIGFQSGFYLTSGNYNSYLGFWAGRGNTTGTYNTFIGAQAGMYNTESNNNVFIGSYVAAEDTIGSENTFMGAAAGRHSSGHDNTFIGAICATQTLFTHHNVYVGGFTGRENYEGNFNVFMGHSSGYWNDGSNNTFVGMAAGADSKGSNNILIGYLAGKFNTSSNKLFIENSDADSTDALIWGDFEQEILRINGRLGVNSNTNNWDEVTIESNDAADLRLRGIGNGLNYASIIFEDNSTNNLWQICHTVSDNLKFEYYNGESYVDKVIFNANGDVNINSGVLQVDSTIYVDALKINRTDSVSDLNEIYFSDYGQIRSSDNNHRIIFDRGNNILEFREFGKILFSSGANTGQRTENLILNSDGTMELNGDFLPQFHNTYSLGKTSMAWSYIYAQSGVVSTSDKRLKTKIFDLDYGLSEIMMLKPITFKWKGKENEKYEIGLIAQEVQPIIKEVVDVGNDANQTLGINYSALVPVLIKGMQEQNVIIETQKEKITDLEKRILKLEKMVMKQ